jgi:hypothetical protein
MSCCGSRRQQFWATPQAASAAQARPSIPAGFAPVQRPGSSFIFEGLATVMTIGSVTGRRYHFPQAGARVAVDPRDAPGLRGKPVIRRS